MKWIKVEDRLPEFTNEFLNSIGKSESTSVLVICEDGKQRTAKRFMSFGGGKDIWYDQDDNSLWSDPTHWQPLPEPPKE